jgi:hypothetical protein
MVNKCRFRYAKLRWDGNCIKIFKEIKKTHSKYSIIEDV